MNLVQRFTRNLDGRDLVCGDIHGNFSGLEDALDDAGFDPSRDRLFSVGDLCDRGPESIASLDWLEKPWFHAVLGNHERQAVLFDDGLVSAFEVRGNGGDWFIHLNRVERDNVVTAFSALPVAIEVETERGVVGIVHAECPAPTWADMVRALGRQNAMCNGFITSCVWSRQRATFGDTALVPDVRAVVCGHTTVDDICVLGNHHFIDTAGWAKGGHFTVLDLATLKRARRPLTKSESGL